MWKWNSLVVSNSAIPWTIQSMEFSRSEYWSGLLFPSPGDLPNTGIKLSSLHCRWILYQLSHKGSPRIMEWVAYPFSRGSFQLRNQDLLCCGWLLYQLSYQRIHRFNVIPIKLPRAFFTELEQNNNKKIKVCMETQKTSSNQRNLENGTGTIRLPDFIR